MKNYLTVFLFSILCLSSCIKKRILSNEDYFKLYNYSKINDTTINNELIQTYIKPSDTLQLFFNKNGILLKEKRDYTSIRMSYIPTDSFYDKQIIDTTHISKTDSFHTKKRYNMIKTNVSFQLHPHYHIKKLDIYKTYSIYTNRNGISNYVTTSYYPKSNSVNKVLYHNKEGLLNGSSYKYYKYRNKDNLSKLYAEYNYKQGKLEGTTTFFYRSGAVRQVDEYKADSLITAKFYTKNGKYSGTLW